MGGGSCSSNYVCPFLVLAAVKCYTITSIRVNMSLSFTHSVESLYNNTDVLNCIILSEDKSSTELSKFRKQIEMIGIEIKGLNEQAQTGRLELKTNFINQHFINELDKIGLQLINIRGTWLRRLVVLLEQRNLSSTTSTQ